MMLFDAHAHYWDDRFVSEWEGGVDALLSALFAENVCGIVNVGTNMQTTLAAIEQAKRYPRMYVAGGIHPGDIPDDAAADTLALEWTPLLQNPENKIVALGEIGLDYHYEPFDKRRQWEFFEAQMLLAKELSLPVVIHDREAHGDSFDMIRRHKDVRGVFHSYSGSAEMAKDLVSRGYMISFSGTLSFKNARVVKEAASILPRDSVMIETDAPYLTPHPFRGRLNHSGYLVHTAQALADVWGCSLCEAITQTTENAKLFFALDSL
ncbi:MAG: TatD family hydrolase [Clostridia bacterium]|nr:TatD family hydrolase [Clostridia bacterium]